VRALSRPVWTSALIAAALWLAAGLVNGLIAGSVERVVVALGRIVRLLVVSPTNALFWTWPMPWSLICLSLAALTVAAAVAVLAPVLGGSRTAPRWAGVWLAVVAAGVVVGLAMDVISTLSTMSVVGWRGATTATLDRAVVGAYWGFSLGWIPALVAARTGRAERADAGAPASTRLSWRGVTVVVLVTVAFVAAGAVGYGAYQQAIVDAQEVLEPRPSELGARPDPAAEGTPPPIVAPSAVPRDPSWCTPEQAMPLLGEADAATGHRVQSIRMMNFSDVPCIVEGYPDVAFADQNGHDLGVVVERGSSFMAQDPGAQPVEIPAGGQAIAYIAWDAQSTQGALVALTLYAAQVAGDERGSWPVVFDITQGSTVEITAWQLDTVGPQQPDTGLGG